MKKRRWWRRLILLLVVAAGAWFVSQALKPKPIAVETAGVVKGPLKVTIDEEGKTEARDRFIVATPVGGRLARITLREGDHVRRGQVVARVSPAPLDPRALEQSRAQLATQEAMQREAAREQERARIAWEQARRDRERSAQLLKTGDIAGQVHERNAASEQEAAQAYEASVQRVEAAAAGVRRARADLIAAQSRGSASAAETIPSPINGRVLQVLEESERVVQPGTPLLVLGGVSGKKELEVVVDVLSTDAVKIQPGAPVELVRWGGERPLEARVRVVEPYAFTKVSALGVEEQRVNVRADFLEDPGPLGDGYRVEAQIQIWYDPEALKVPMSALVREGEGWIVFTIGPGGLAQKQQVEVGQRNGQEAQIVKGLSEGEKVIIHPPNDLEPGVQVQPVQQPASAT